MKTLKPFLLPLVLASTAAYAEEKTIIFSSDFESESSKWALVYGADLDTSTPHSGSSSVKIDNEASIRTKATVAEAGTMELWLRTSTPATNYKIRVLVNSTLSNDAGWVQVGNLEGTQNDTEYHAKRISVDDPGKKYIRLDVTSVGGSVVLDDISIDRILLSTALQKNQQQVLDEVMGKLRDDQSYQLQTDALKALGKNYTSQIELQRQYIEYSNGIYSTISLVLATSERSKMANPLGYQTFKKVIDDVKSVSSPIQKTRMDSLIKPFGDIATASLNIVTAGQFNAFAEPFKSIVATSFEKSSYENSGITKEQKKFAEKSGLQVYQTAEKFLGEIDKELQKANMLDKDLANIQADVDSFRKDMSKNLKEYLVYGGVEKTAENYNRVMSKDNQIREAAMRDINEGFAAQAESLQTRSGSNAQLVQFMMKANSRIDNLQEYKDRFNQITSAMITFYDKFDKSIAPDQNPFSSPEDRKAWEQHAVKTREYIQQSKEAFKKAYL